MNDKKAEEIGGNFPEPDDARDRIHYLAGFRAYRDGAEYDRTKPEPWRKGWAKAKRAERFTSTSVDEWRFDV